MLASPHMSDEGYELEYIHDAFQKNWIAPLGENVNKFEKAMGEFMGKGYPVALSAGTAALHLAMILAGVKTGDTVFCQSLTFSASANPVAYCGAKPVFIDSDNGNKIITTSGGGMLLCRTEDEAKHALKLSTQARENAPWYQHEEIGYNYRMSNICAGIGRGQMKVLPLRVEQKRAIFARYCENLKGLPLTMQPKLDCAEPNRWLSVALLDEGCGVTPGEMLAKLNEAGIEGRYLWKPMHLQPVFAGCPFVSVSDAPVGDDLFARGVCLPSDTKMSMDDVDRVCEVIRGMF